MTSRVENRRLDRSSSLATRSVLLALVVGLSACSSVTDQRIGRVLPESVEAGAMDVGIRDPGITTFDATAAIDASTSVTDASAGSDASSCGQPRELDKNEPTLALYILLDRSAAMRSGSLQNDKWNAVRPALTTYVNSAPAHLSLGLGYFPLQDNTPCSCMPGPKCNCWDRPVCTPSSYQPNVEMAPLSNEQQRPKLVGSLDNTQPNGAYGGLAPAIRQSEIYLSGWQKSELGKGKKAVRVIITASPPGYDGSCAGDGGSGDVTDLVESSEFRTYVVAVSGEPRGFEGYNWVAQEGSSREALRLDVQNRPLDAMFAVLNQIVDWEKGCDYDIASGIDPKTIQVQLGDKAMPLKLEANRQRCRFEPAWFMKADRISLCDGTCKDMHNDGLVSSLVTRCVASPITN